MPKKSILTSKNSSCIWKIPRVYGNSNNKMLDENHQKISSGKTVKDKNISAPYGLKEVPR